MQTSTTTQVVGTRIVSESKQLPLPFLGENLYLRYGIAGGLSAFSTHAIMVPLDVVKTRIQIEPAKYNKGMVQAFQTVLQQDGMKGLTLGFSATAFGYFIQGACKFGFFEVIKQGMMHQIGYERIMNGDLKYLQFPIYVSASACAEAIATVMLSPWEAIRIKTVNQPDKYGAMNVWRGLAMIAREEGLLSGYFRGLVPILLKQVPYTVTQLTVFSYATEYFYRSLLPNMFGKSKNDLNTKQQLNVSLACGVLAGLSSAIASHPADTLLSLVNKPGEKRSVLEILKHIGFRGVWAGIVPRCIMVSSLSAAMFLVYDGTKVLLGLPTTGGK
ncbi:hypothetical protein C9374_010477 [Naegleria lovaniensis]|uniref:Mitochondrial carrier protein n=1 Tax=Naegleria lovaniensis TaxID=51637 RepID=A0AA88KE63_NAELO|nr:uncharacterized protein C9374_010477 [Naegleria lovaniensis]KAG2374733.1 hypothetical protein C9374_010477 [Naegleria lovaniensis]